jgi:hypothetical protein
VCVCGQQLFDAYQQPHTVLQPHQLQNQLQQQLPSQFQPQLQPPQSVGFSVAPTVVQAANFQSMAPVQSPQSNMQPLQPAVPPVNLNATQQSAAPWLPNNQPTVTPYGYLLPSSQSVLVSAAPVVCAVDHQQLQTQSQWVQQQPMVQPVALFNQQIQFPVPAPAVPAAQPMLQMPYLAAVAPTQPIVNVPAAALFMPSQPQQPMAAPNVRWFNQQFGYQQPQYDSQ